VPILLFLVYAAVVVVFALVLAYCLSVVEEQTLGRRCRMPHEIHRRRKLKRQRVRCRFEG
jgi:hypothetical protein